jgi:hypothetical protein
LDAESQPVRASPSGSQNLGSMSLFALPVSKGARMARVVAVLLLDLVLAGAGIAMIVSYMNDRAEAAARGSAPVVEQAPPPAVVDTLEPDPVDAEEVKRQPAKRARRVAKRRRPAASKPAGGRAEPGGGSPAPDPGPGSDPRPDPEPDPSPGPDPDPRPDPDPGPGPEPRPGGDTGADPDPGGGDGTLEPDPNEDRRVEFSAAKVRRVVDRHRVQLQKCYQQAAKQASPSKPLAGRVDIQFVIMPDGNATNVRAVSNTTGSDKLAGCVKGLIEGWQFPSPGAEEIAFVWPFLFKAP